jgi:hypothetical protein
MKDYYSILHVLPSAEIDVIKAAYKALARKYHPDTFDGDKAYAGKRMQEINDAFGVIGNSDKRKQYDAERRAANSQNDYSENGEDVDASTEEDWIIACKYCPDAMRTFDYLHRLSRALAFSFKSYLLDTKKFDICNNIGGEMEDNFLKTYFGKKKEIQSFAKALILVGEQKAALQVNRAVKIMGDSLNITLVRNQTYADFPMTLRKLCFFDVKYCNFTSSVGEALLTSLGIKFNRSFGCNFEYRGKTHRVANNELRNWILNNLNQHPDLQGI